MTVVSGVLAGVAGLVAVLAVAATRVPSLDRPFRVAVVVVEVLVVGYVVADTGLLLRTGDRPDSLVTHVGYAVASVGLLPALAWRQPAADGAEDVEHTGDTEDSEPVSPWVVAVALVAVAICLLRLAQTR